MIEKAAKAIASANALLFTSGAGLGVDSGLPDFRYYFILFYFIFIFILFYFILFYFILFYFNFIYLFIYRPSA